ncbi:MFS transporter [Loigolactobacillus bifermentans]|uniref:EmrB QacA subfamily drug resistance transporter n=1 Tax=Loigolactobacillus bifermentans DSM 20003 TaxID=1423726 RepID=A0A0R1GUL4_9LACO|nr:MFS transporter [Loigolactobacillus bifermentans]KRK35409.1 EmrB QacA subfamily drug resistance transporter [Loigolactobacillus bifermentans DSM 20003]QGG60397.1 DHA2 family efflux MFS transporter permease subunit [Loigolactobacillus bifermentans]
MGTQTKKWWVLATVSVAVFMAMLDITIVNVALPDIQTAFHVTFSTLQWVLNAYTLVYAVMLLPVSKLGDMIGRKPVFLGGLVIFAAGSLASGLAASGLWLNIFRGFQGIGGAAMMSLSLTIVNAAFPARQRGVALGIWSSAVGLAVAAGPLIGGSLVAAFGWRSIFLVNLPIGVIALLAGSLVIQRTARDRTQHLDLPGLLLSAVLIFGIILGLIQKENHSADSWLAWRVSGWFALALVALVLFIVVERRRSQPMVKLALFKSRSFVGANLAAFTLGAGLYGGFTYLIILMQNYMGYSEFDTGLRMLLISAFALVVGPLAGILAGKFGNRWLITIALLLGAAGVLTMAYQIKVPFKWAMLVPGFILLGLSNALVSPPISNAVMGSVPAADSGMASGILNVCRQFGISFGVVILGIRVSAGYRDALPHQLAQVAGLPATMLAPIKHLLLQAGAFVGQGLFTSRQAQAFAQQPFFAGVKRAVATAFQAGMQNSLWLIAILLTLGALASAVLIRDQNTR